jgi:hypothetical protein
VIRNTIHRPAAPRSSGPRRDHEPRVVHCALTGAILFRRHDY